MIKIKTESDQEIKKMKMKMDEVKVSVSTATKGMRESLDKAETNIADLIKEVTPGAEADSRRETVPTGPANESRPKQTTHCWQDNRDDLREGPR